MKSNAELLEQYKEEKALVIGAPDERTGLEDFPSFQEWKAQYVTEYNETHVTVDTDEADALADATVAEADEELETLVAELEPELDELEAAEEAEEDEEKETAPSEPVTDDVIIGAPAKPKAAPKKRAKKAAPKKTAAKKATKKVTKKAKGEKIFTKYFGKAGWTRAKIIEKLVSDAGLTHNGAATYYQTMKKKAEA